MPYFANRVKDSTTAPGTGNATITGTAPTGFVNFNSAFGLNRSFVYCIAASSSANWEIGYGHLSASTTLVRDQVIDSSNSGSIVNFSSGAFDVFNTIDAKSIDGANHGHLYAASRGMFLQ
jgi:hypothetical protein